MITVVLLSNFHFPPYSNYLALFFYLATESIKYLRPLAINLRDIFSVKYADLSLKTDNFT